MKFYFCKTKQNNTTQAFLLCEGVKAYPATWRDNSGSTVLRDSSGRFASDSTSNKDDAGEFENSEVENKKEMEFLKEWEEMQQTMINDGYVNEQGLATPITIEEMKQMRVLPPYFPDDAKYQIPGWTLNLQDTNSEESSVDQQEKNLKKWEETQQKMIDDGYVDENGFATPVTIKNMKEMRMLPPYFPDNGKYQIPGWTLK